MLFKPVHFDKKSILMIVSFDNGARLMDVRLEQHPSRFPVTTVTCDSGVRSPSGQ